MMMARPGMAPVPMGGPQVRGPQPSFQYTKTARNPPMQGMPGQAVVAASMPQQAVQIPGQEPLTATMLAAAPPQEQKQMLGERLFPLIQRMYPDLAGKITGMLLEIDNAELLHMLEDGNSLKSKVRYFVLHELQKLIICFIRLRRLLLSFRLIKERPPTRSKESKKVY